MAVNINEFLKEMTAETGLYGEELFALIREKVLNKSQKTASAADSIEKRVMNDKDWEPRKEVERFHGDVDSIKLFYQTCGGDPKIASYFGCSSPGLVCARMAIVCDVKEFYWTRPVILMKGNKTMGQGWVRYGVKWNHATKTYLDVPEERINEI